MISSCTKHQGNVWRVVTLHYLSDADCCLCEKALVVLHKWIEKNQENATGNELERALKRIGREDIINQCMRNVEEVTDEQEKQQALVFLEGPAMTAAATVPPDAGAGK